LPGVNAPDQLVVTRLLDAVAAPVLYPRSFELPAAVVEAYPARLPPLRSDVPTLVVGKLKPGKVLAYTVAGEVDGRPMRYEASPAVPRPEPDHFFLVTTVAQWRAAKDRPALMPADRALAFAFEQNQMARA